MWDFGKRGKPEYWGKTGILGENPLAVDYITNKLNTHMVSKPEWNPTMVEGEFSHHCNRTALHFWTEATQFKSSWWLDPVRGFQANCHPTSFREPLHWLLGCDPIPKARREVLRMLSTRKRTALLFYRRCILEASQLSDWSCQKLRFVICFKINKF